MLPVNTDIWVIANFFSGTLSQFKKEEIAKEIAKLPNCKIFKTEYPNHAKEIAHLAIKAGVKIVVAIGGDGTLNEVGSVLRGTNIAMGIVPIGSGNGLARHLKISLVPKKAIECIRKGTITEIDTCTINEIPFFCTAGVGFDAHVANGFSQQKSRGFFTYIVTSIKTFFSYKSIDYQIDTIDSSFKKNAFAITFANASQYGNNAVVAPESKIDDGLIDTVILKPFSIFSSVFLAIRLFTNSFSKSKFVETIKGQSFKIKVNSPCVIHFDGEPKILNTSELIIKIEEKKLKIIV